MRALRRLQLNPHAAPCLRCPSRLGIRFLILSLTRNPCFHPPSPLRAFYHSPKTPPDPFVPLRRPTPLPRPTARDPPYTCRTHRSSDRTTSYMPHLSLSLVCSPTGGVLASAVANHSGAEGGAPSGPVGCMVQRAPGGKAPSLRRYSSVPMMVPVVVRPRPIWACGVWGDAGERGLDEICGLQRWWVSWVHGAWGCRARGGWWGSGKGACQGVVWVAWVAMAGGVRRCRTWQLKMKPGVPRLGQMRWMKVSKSASCGERSGEAK